MSLWTALSLALRRRFGGPPGKRRQIRASQPPPRPAMAASPPTDALRLVTTEAATAQSASIAAETVTPIAIPIAALGESGERAPALEAVLQQVGGVVRAYVSPFTRLAYLDYEPGTVTEAQLVGAIAAAGYSVDDRRRPFAWRRP